MNLPSRILHPFVATKIAKLETVLKVQENLIEVTIIEKYKFKSGTFLDTESVILTLY